MTLLQEAIYRYLMEDKVHYYMDQKAYNQNAGYRARHEEALSSTLTEKQKEHLEALMDALSEMEYIEAEAIFCAALSTGLELGKY